MNYECEVCGGFGQELKVLGGLVATVLCGKHRWDLDSTIQETGSKGSEIETLMHQLNEVLLDNRASEIVYYGRGPGAIDLLKNRLRDNNKAFAELSSKAKIIVDKILDDMTKALPAKEQYA